MFQPLRQRLANLSSRVELLFKDLAEFPWRTTAHTLRERFREDQLGLTASSLTFTTSLALVPFFTVALAVFTAFPMFSQVQQVLQRWLVQSLIPDSIARQVLGYLTQFSLKASKLGSVGLAVVLVTALALILTIDRTLNRIWRVRRPRPLGQRVLIYWAAITLGPLLLGASLLLTSTAVALSSNVVGDFAGSVKFLLEAAQFAMLCGGMAALFHYVPNTRVRWRHALSGGVFVAVGIEVAKRALTLYVSSVPTYSAVYGAFATLPILLIWIYTAWVIVLLGAVMAAYMPSLTSGVGRRPSTHGWHFQLAVEALQQLYAARQAGEHGRTGTQVAQSLGVDVLQLETVFQTLAVLDWVGKLDELEDGTGPSQHESRYVLLADLDTTLLAPLAERLLLADSLRLENLWENSRLRSMYLREVL